MKADTPKFLIVEDDPNDIFWWKNVFASQFQEAGSFHFAETLREALKALEDFKPDLVVLDLMLPDSTGLKSLEAIRSRAPQYPVVISSGDENEAKALQALKIGAQDYLYKDDREPSQVFRSLLFALERHQQCNQTTLDLAHQLKLDLLSQQLKSYVENEEGKSIDLTPFEFKMLALFASNRDRVLKRQEILEKLKGSLNSDLTERTVDVHISTLKQKVPSLKQVIHSVYGEGYVLSDKSLNENQRESRV